jgi:hypothetical protein
MPEVVERNGRKYVSIGIGTVGWNVIELYREVDDSGNFVSDSLEYFTDDHQPYRRVRRQND